MKHCTA